MIPANLLKSYLDTTIAYVEGGTLVGPEAMPLDTTILVISGQNPMDRVLDAAENARLHAALRLDLMAAGCQPQEVRCTGACGTHGEDAWAVMDVDDGGQTRRLVMDLARAFDQRAIFHVTDATVAILMTDGTHDGRVAGQRKRHHDDVTEL